MTGMITSSTIEDTIFPKAVPIITPTARSTTFHFIAKSRNSFMIRIDTYMTQISHKSVIIFVPVASLFAHRWSWISHETGICFDDKRCSIGAAS